MNMDDCKNCRALKVRIDELEKQVNLHVAYQMTAVEKANNELRDRLAGMNEFRDTLKDQASRFITREDLENKFSIVDHKLQHHSHVISNWQGRIWALGIMVVVFSGAISAAMSWLTRQ